MIRTAAISPCFRYRYDLTRVWGRADLSVKRAVVIGLNPSDADATIDDPTIRRTIDFAQREGCAQLVMINLFALRSPYPEVMVQADDPVGPMNDQWLAYHIGHPVEQIVIAAWGAHPMARARGSVVSARFNSTTFYCLGKNNDGSPKHPLYLPKTAPLEVWR